jgi:hypothetical protein
MRVFPSPGLLVRDPVKRDFLPPDGREVGDGDFYWLRRIACGDATATKPTVAPEVLPSAVNETKPADLPAAAPVLADTKAIKSTPSDGSDSQ